MNAKVINWNDRIEPELALMGHRNWIVVADAAYPAQTSPGIETVHTGADEVVVLREVLQALDRSEHVNPIVWLDAEMQHLDEALAPGIGQYRQELEGLLHGRSTQRLPHAELIARLDAAGKTFRVLLLKTDLQLPYTSVFLELDCGYWGPEQERQLRERMDAST